MGIIDRIRTFIINFIAKKTLELPDYKYQPEHEEERIYTGPNKAKKRFEEIVIKDYPIGAECTINEQIKLKKCDVIPSELKHGVPNSIIERMESAKDIYPIYGGKLVNDSNGDEYKFVVQQNKDFSYSILGTKGLEKYKPGIKYGKPIEIYTIEYNWDENGHSLSKIEEHGDANGKTYLFHLIGKKKKSFDLPSSSIDISIKCNDIDYNSDEIGTNEGFVVNIENRDGDKVTLNEYYISQCENPDKIQLQLPGEIPLMEYMYDKDKKCYIDKHGKEFTLEEIREIKEYECGIDPEFYDKLLRQFKSKNQARRLENIRKIVTRYSPTIQRDKCG